MAEGLLRHYRSDRYEVYSAGNNPSSVNSFAIQVMSELGIDIKEQKSKSVKDFEGYTFGKVITLCDTAKETCPMFYFEYIEHLHWGFSDPAKATGTEDEQLRAFRDVRDQIHYKINETFEDI